MEHEHEHQPEVVKEKPTPATNSNPSTQVAVLAVAFLLLGILIGAFGYDQLISSQRGMIAEVVATEIASQTNVIANQVVTSLMEGIQQQQEPQGLQPGQRLDVSYDEDPAIGSPDAPIVIIEFSDFRCPYCARFANDTLQPILENYGEYVYFVFRDFAILGQESVNASVAAECAYGQDQFWAYHDLLFANQQTLGRDTYMQLAETLELNMDEFTSCLDSTETLEEVRADTTVAANLGATGTPTFFINGIYISGAQPFEVFAEIIEQELSAAGIDF